jgi:hypothetical protein
MARHNGLPAGRRISGWAVVWLCVALACSDEGAAARGMARDEAERQLLTDASAALHAARSALTEYGPDPALSLLAARACLALDRRGDALAHADAGLDAEDLDQDTEADLNWARGTALMGRFQELSNQIDWRGANRSLEMATRAGSRRVEAATLLVFLQDMGLLGSTTRRDKFAQLVYELDTGGKAAEQVRAYLAAQGG